MTSKDNDTNGSINSVFKLVTKFEFNTNGGKWNVLFSLGILSLGVIFAGANALVEIAYMFLFKKEYPSLSYYAVLIPFLLIGTACFLYMVFIADKYLKVKNKAVVLKKRKKIYKVKEYR